MTTVQDLKERFTSITGYVGSGSVRVFCGRYTQTTAQKANLASRGNSRRFWETAVEIAESAEAQGRTAYVEVEDPGTFEEEQARCEAKYPQTLSLGDRCWDNGTEYEIVATSATNEGRFYALEDHRYRGKRIQSESEVMEGYIINPEGMLVDIEIVSDRLEIHTYLMPGPAIYPEFEFVCVSRPASSPGDAIEVTIDYDHTGFYIHGWTENLNTGSKYSFAVDPFTRRWISSSPGASRGNTLDKHTRAMMEFFAMQGKALSAERIYTFYA